MLRMESGFETKSCYYVMCYLLQLSQVMRERQIWKLYHELPYIIYRKKFLIPPKPHRPLHPYTQLSIQRKYQIREMKDESQMTFHEKIMELIQAGDQFYLKCQKQYNEKIQLYKREVKEYEEKYIQPAKLPFLRAHSDYFGMRLRNPQNKGKNMKDFLLEWKNLPEEERKQYISNFEKKKESWIKDYIAFVHKHEIPTVSKCRSVSLFIGENITSEKNKISSDLFTLYKNLPQQKKQQYKHIANQKHNQSVKLFKQFLDRWKITHKQLKYIQAVCSKYEKLRKTKSQDYKHQS